MINISLVVHVTNTFMLNLSSCTVVPTITQGPIDTPGVLGGSVMFTCIATGIPLPIITWMDENDDTMLTADDMVISGTTILSTLTLSNLQDDDFDNYTCTATNMFDSDDVTTLLGSELQCYCNFTLLYKHFTTHIYPI